MGLTIGYYHITKDLSKIQKVMHDMKIYAENTGRYFRTFMNKGVVHIDKPFYDNGMRNTSFEPGEHDRALNYHFFDWSFEHLRKGGPESNRIGFEIEIKNGTDDNEMQTLEVAWFKVGDEWIADDWHKLYSPSTEKTEKLVMTVIEMIAFLEYIKRYYFPSFRIDDEFDFHTDWNDVKDSQKQFWKDIMNGDYPNYRRPDGTFPDYEAEHKALKNHDVGNIYHSLGEMDKVFGMIEGKLHEVGYTDDMIEKGVSIQRAETGISKTSVQVGNSLVEQYHDSIRGIILRSRRPVVIKPMPRRMPLDRVMITRKDGVPQHYYKRIEYKK